MRGITSGILIFTLIILVVEILGFLGITLLVRRKKRRWMVGVTYWFFTAVFLTLWLAAFLDTEKIRHTTDYSFFYLAIFISVLNFFPKALLSLFVILSVPFSLARDKIRSQIILLSGLILSSGMVLTIGYGLIAGKKVIRMEEFRLDIADLPAGLNGVKIVHISDIHLGSYGRDRFLKRCVEKINKVEPDFILFTGDMVNNFYQEIVDFEDQLGEFKARSGKFAILGNHDYGDYSDWNSPKDKALNLKRIKQKVGEAGFQLLLNRSVKVNIRDTSLYIIGVENWGHPPFPQYARLDSARQNIPEKSFQILLTHDPAHWSDQVLYKTDIPLTLAGHTHGGQFAIKIAGMEFSLISLINKYWGGLYRENNQFLYVNRGLGCVGLPARIDMAPEITVITLFRE
ncbi:MAG: metallophosphoesterase [Prolixibacteraceae bacterium]